MILSTAHQTATSDVFPPAPVVHARHYARTSAGRTPWSRPGDIADGSLNKVNLAFDTDAFRVAYRPGATIYCYCLGATALQSLAGRLRLPLFKWGWAAHPVQRRDQLRGDRYGAVVRRGKAFEIDPQGWDDWELQLTSDLGPISPGAPILALHRCFSLRLPDSLTPRAFERTFNAIVSNCSLNCFAASAVGRRHFAALSIEPSSAPRYTRYLLDHDTQRLSPATEILISRPREGDWARMRVIAERIILGHLLGPTYLAK